MWSSTSVNRSWPPRLGPCLPTTTSIPTGQEDTPTGGPQEATSAGKPQPGRSVAKEPELLSPSYRNRVRKLSPGKQNRDVRHPLGRYMARLTSLGPRNGPKICSRYSISLSELVGRTGFEPVTSSVSGKSRAVSGVCHRRTGSNGELLTCANILTGSR
jgi:hypothetical protein